MFKKVAIAGLGLIGGSVAIALKTKFPELFLIGITRDVSKIVGVPQAKFFDKIVNYSDLEVVRECDFCLISTVVSAIPDTFRKLKRYLREDVVVTDVGSVKSWIVSEINDRRFVGSHPMAGSEKSGIHFSDPRIFDNSVCVVTPNNNPKECLERVSEFWNMLGMKVVYLSPEIHDKVVAYTSHFIHLISYAISFVLSSSEFSESKFFEVFGKGLVDTTRVSRSDPNLWIEIFQKNRENILSILEDFIEELVKVRNDISENRWDLLREFLLKAKDFRDSIG